MAHALAGKVRHQAGGLRAGDQQGRQIGCDVLDRDRTVCRKVEVQKITVMPVGTGAGHHQELVLAETGGGHLGQDLALFRGEINKADPPCLRQAAGDHAAKPVSRAGTADHEAREAGQLQHADMLGDVAAFRADRIEPGLPVIAVGRMLGLAVTREPVGTLPSAVGPERRTGISQPVIERRDLGIAPGRPLDLREMHRIFVAVGLDRLGLGVFEIDMVGETTRIDGPAVGLGLALDDDV